MAMRYSGAQRGNSICGFRSIEDPVEQVGVVLKSLDIVLCRVIVDGIDVVHEPMMNLSIGRVSSHPL